MIKGNWRFLWGSGMQLVGTVIHHPGTGGGIVRRIAYIIGLGDSGGNIYLAIGGGDEVVRG